MKNCLISSLTVANYHDAVGKTSTKLSKLPLKIVTQNPYRTLAEQIEIPSHAWNRQVHT